MSYIAAEDVAKAKEMDLLTYLRNYEPQELVHVSGNTYCTREHDSLRISNGKWCWFSQGIGGRSALDYLIKVKGIPFTQAAEIILGREAEKPPVFYRQKERRSTELLMPELSETTDRVEKYLQGRGIHPVIIRYCLDNRLLFESADFHSAVLVGYDKDGKARYGALRSTVSSYKGELTGSDKHFSFFLEGKPNAEHIHVFESAIDLLSFATLALLAGHDWKSETYLSLAGVFQTKRENVVPVALSRFLDEHPSVRKIHLHLDNDAVGRGAVKSYANLNVDTERIARNVHFKDTGGLTYNEYFQRLIDEGKISTRGQKAGATIFNELVIDVNTRYFEEHGGYEYAKQFYEEAYRFGCEIYGEDNIVSAVMHADEINKAVSEELGKPVYHYHLHIVAIPTVRKEILWSKRCKDEALRGTVKEVIKQVSHSKKWKNTVPLLDENGQQVISKYGKPMFHKSYSVLQDKLFAHMTEAGFTGFERGVLGSTAENLSSLDYQIQKDKEGCMSMA